MRCSSLPRFLTCPSSELPTDHPYGPPSEVAELGTAVHEALAAHVMGTEPDLRGVAQKYGVDVDELDRLFAYGCIAWAALKRYFPNVRTEEPLRGDGVRGTADLLHRDESTMCVGDWKSGRVRRDHRDQVLGYAAAAVDQYGMPESGQVSVCVVWLQHFEYEVWTFDQADIDRLHEDVGRAKAEIGKRYSPGEACTYCPRQLECGARRDFLQSAAQALIPVVDVEIKREFLPRLYSKAKQLRKALDCYDKALKMALRDGPLPDGEGNVLELAEMKRDRLKPLEAWPELVGAGFTEEGLADCVSLSKTAVMQIISDAAPRGQKGKAKAEFLQLLRDAGAVTERISETVKVKKGEQP